MFEDGRLTYICFIVFLSLSTSDSKDDLIKKELKPKRYILYDVNPGEGFNLRRDVYMRMAVFVRKLNQKYTDRHWVLVLPPWSHMYHWQSRQLGHQTQIPWSHFFRLDSLAPYVPVVEFHTWLKETEGELGAIYYLQGYKEGWKNGKFEEKFDLRDCLEPPRYRKSNEDNKWEGQMFGYGDKVRGDKFSCVSVQGHTSLISGWLADMSEQSIMLDRAENLLHDWFGDKDYWGARRSMQFAKKLVGEALQFIREEMDEVEGDNVGDWTDHRIDERKERGGTYACVHLRRGDFAKSRKDQVPSIGGASRQLAYHLKEKGLTKLFIATDGTKKEVEDITRNLESKGVKIYKYNPDGDKLEQLKDGGVAVVDQIICSHSRYFLGTKESTFTFRIQEEREILGYPVGDTFDMLCTDKEWKKSQKCEGGSEWKIDWGPKGFNWDLPDIYMEESVRDEL